MFEPTIVLFKDHTALVTGAAQGILVLARQAVAEHGSFHIALAGGSTPKALYRHLADPDVTAGLDWSKTHIWFGDERCVPPDHAQSNYRMAYDALLGHVAIPPGNIHRMHGETEPTTAAKAYASALAALLPSQSGMPLFDLVLLGIGTDGHIASLFPGSDNLRQREHSVWAAHIDAEKGWRISLTLPVIQAARHILLLASGPDKAQILARVLGDAPNRDELPAALIRDLPQLQWFLDQPAAGDLPPYQSTIQMDGS